MSSVKYLSHYLDQLWPNEINLTDQQDPNEAYLDLDASGNNDWSEWERVWADGSDENGRDVRVDHGSAGRCGVGRGAGRSGDDKTWREMEQEDFNSLAPGRFA